MGREEERLHFVQSALLSFFVSGVDGMGGSGGRTRVRGEGKENHQM